MSRISRPRFATSVLLGLPLLLFGQVHAQLPDLQPAMFGPSSGLTDIEIVQEEFGSIDSVAVRCQVFVETDGSLTDYLCVTDDGIDDRSIIATVSDRLATEKFTPARADGSKVRVLMNFAVFFTCMAGDCTAVPVPHHGYHLEALGLDYVAPQPIVSGREWYDGFEDRGPLYASGLRGSGWFTAAVEVDSEGVASTSCIYALANVVWDDTRQQNRKKLESILNRLVETRYVPGFHEGTPVQTQFFESNNFRFAVWENGQARDRGFATEQEAPELYCER